MRAFPFFAMLVAVTLSVPALAEGLPAHPMTRDDVAAWLDGFMPYALARGDIAGAVVVVVRDGNTLYQAGYGYADLENGKPMDPERTLIRPGSVGKLFTWTAVMQLVEAGRLDLDADVNRYLNFEISGEPVTLRNLMTHSGGFEEQIKNVATETSSGISLRERMRWIPPQISAPGSTSAYSNYGAGLAGYIVERVSGEPYEDYIQHHILEPLGMQRSTMQQPLPEHLQADMALGYSRTSVPEPGHFDLVGIAPAGGISATAADMGRFMLAHLQDGALGDARILRADTAERMRTETHDVVPNVNPMALGFYRRDINGRRVVGHGGDLNFFRSDLALFIDDGVGLFVSLNSLGREGAAHPLRTALFEAFADRYFPGSSPDGGVDAATASGEALMIAGVYESSRRWESGILSSLSILGQTTVTATPDGSISVSDMQDVNGAPMRWKQIAPFVWRQIGGHPRLAAVVENGTVVRYAVDPAPFVVFDRAPWWRSSAVTMPLLGSALGLLFVAVLSWPVTALVRRHYKVPATRTGTELWAHRSAHFGALLALAAFASCMMLVMNMVSHIGDLLSATSDGLVITMRAACFVIFIAAVLAALWNAWVTWSSHRNRWRKSWSAALLLACVITVYYAQLFGFMGFSAHY